MLGLIVLITGGVLAAAPAGAQSFNCYGVTAADERAICADAGLSQLDSDMAQSYNELIEALQRRGLSGDVASLRQSQRGWIADRRSCGPERACLRDTYEERYTYLRRLLHNLGGY